MYSVLYYNCKAHYTQGGFVYELFLSKQKDKSIMKTNIKALRAEHRLSQEELANAVGVTRQTILSIENEKYVASLPLAYKIAKYFGLKIEEVFNLSEIEEEL